MIETWVHRKKTKLPTPWTSNIPKLYKRNTIKAELYQAKRISSNFTNEVNLIRTKNPIRFVNSVIHEFTTAQIMRTMNSSFHLGFLKIRKKLSL